MLYSFFFFSFSFLMLYISHSESVQSSLHLQELRICSSYTLARSGMHVFQCGAHIGGLVCQKLRSILPIKFYFTRASAFCKIKKGTNNYVEVKFKDTALK